MIHTFNVKFQERMFLFSLKFAHDMINWKQVGRTSYPSANAPLGVPASLFLQEPHKAKYPTNGGIKMNNVAVVSAGESLVSEIVGYISELVPIQVDEVRKRLSSIVANYHVQKVETHEVHPDLTDKIALFMSAKRLEGLSETTLYDYDLQLRMFADRVKKRAEDITTADIRIYLGQFKDQKASTVATKLSTLKSFFGWLADEDILQKDPAARINPPKQEKRFPRALTIEELELMRESCETIRQRAILEVLYSTGCRLSEVADIDRDDIDYQSNSCMVIGKGNKERRVFFSYKSMYHLRKYLMSRLDDCPALFVTERKPHRRLSRRMIQDEIKKIAIKTNIQKDISPHTLRHTFATILLNNGAPLAEVQALLGHENPSTTMIYATLSEDRKRESHQKYLVQ